MSPGLMSQSCRGRPTHAWLKRGGSAADHRPNQQQPSLRPPITPKAGRIRQGEPIPLPLGMSTISPTTLCNPVVTVYLFITSTLTLELDSSLAHSLEESARREHKPVATWARERLRIAAMETEAEANGYSVAWLKLFGCIEDESFSAPPRSATRQIESFDEA